VLLTGETRTEELKADITRQIKVMKNVTEVFNELIPAPLSALSARANDSFLTARIKSTFIANEGVPSNSMRVVTEASKVYLMGIATEAEANRAVNIARSVPGVKQVTKLFDLISESDKKRLDGQK
jgi:osmotically-inducible protein OsmY